MKFLSYEKISDHRYKTPEGYLICLDSVLARTGKQTYTRREVFGDACKDADSDVEIDRPADEVFSDKTLASFENKPLTNEHPNEDVTIENHNDYSVGFVRDIKRGKTSDGEDVMLGTLVITDAKAIEDVENGKTDLSCGYDCDINDDDNPCQRNIRGNHVALCQQGRAGIAHIVDSINDATEEQWQNSLWDYSISYDFISGGYGMKFKSASDYNKAKALAEKLHYKGGHWYDQDLEYYSYGSSRIGNDDSINDSLQVWQVHQGYAIVAKKYWNQYGNKAYADRVEQSIESARYTRSSLERNDHMSFVIIDCNDGNHKVKDENMKDIKTTTQSGIDKIIYTMQSDADKNLYFYIGKNFSMKEGMFGYTKYVMDDMTPDQLKNELIRNGWHQTASGPAKVIDTSLAEIDNSVKDVNPKEGESKEDFISRFMKETKEEYPDMKQRLAVAYSYWKKSHTNDSVKDKSLKRFEIDFKDAKGRNVTKVVKAKSLEEVFNKYYNG